MYYWSYFSYEEYITGNQSTTTTSNTLQWPSSWLLRQPQRINASSQVTRVPLDVQEQSQGSCDCIWPRTVINRVQQTSSWILYQDINVFLLLPWGAHYWWDVIPSIIKYVQNKDLIINCITTFIYGLVKNYLPYNHRYNHLCFVYNIWLLGQQLYSICPLSTLCYVPVQERGQPKHLVSTNRRNRTTDVPTSCFLRNYSISFIFTGCGHNIHTNTQKIRHTYIIIYIDATLYFVSTNSNILQTEKSVWIRLSKWSISHRRKMNIETKL